MVDIIDKGAQFSNCKKYRYTLWRIWNKDKPLMMCIGLNPSNANAEKNDPTITNLIKMLSRLGYGGFYMTNLYAWISSNPKELLSCADPIGENDSYLDDINSKCDFVLFCWGAFKEAAIRSAEVSNKYPMALCFGLTKGGTPLHPLALMYKGRTNKAKLYYYSVLSELHLNSLQ